MWRTIGAVIYPTPYGNLMIIGATPSRGPALPDSSAGTTPKVFLPDVHPDTLG
ncbi:MAG: hypothetical protein ACFE89_01250 [Candidatus Hodarchaeota archaeon]